MRILTLRTAAVVLGLLVPGAAMAQVGNPLPQALGMGGNYTALARGIGAPAWNPAGLGMPSNPGASFTFLPMSFTAGLSPITPADLAEYDGELIPREAREEWVTRITEEGGERGSLGADITHLALSVGRVAISASSSVRSRVNMAPDVAEVFFFGNAGLTGEAGDYDLEGSNFDVAGTSTVAASIGFPVNLSLGPLPDQSFALGATVKYTVGNFLVLGQENQSSLTSNPIAVNVRFPMVHTPFYQQCEAGDPDCDPADDIGLVESLNNGSGIGVDVGAAWQGGIFSAGVVIKNIVNTFEWDTESLQFRDGEATFNADTSFTNFEKGDIADAPPELVERIDSLYTFSPVLAAGAGAQILPFLMVTGELRHSLSDNLDVGSRNHVGVGAELTILPILPIRAGVAAISGGYALSGGLGLKLGPVQFSFAGSARETELGADAVGSFGLTFGVR